MEEHLTPGRRKLAEENMALVKVVLRRMHIRREYEEMEAAGYLGLCRAAARWREGGEPFPAFAARLIAHEIVDCLRRARPAERAAACEPYAEDPGFCRVEDRQLIAGMDSALPGLVGPRDAMVGRLLLRGFSPGAVATKLHMRPAVVSRARRRVARALRRWADGPLAKP